jgi:hypothetical protein
MKLIKSKKALVLLGVLVVAVVAAVGAYAYFTSGGSGTGSASVGTAADNLVVTGTPDSTALTPGGTGSVISFSVHNPAGFSQAVSNIHLSGVVACNQALSAGNTCASGHEIAGCGTFSDGALPNDSSADFYMADVTVDPSSTGDGNIPATGTTALSEFGTLVMNDTGLNQDACKTAHLALSFTSS